MATLNRGTGGKIQACAFPRGRKSLALAGVYGTIVVDDLPTMPEVFAPRNGCTGCLKKRTILIRPAQSCVKISMSISTSILLGFSIWQLIFNILDCGFESSPLYGWQQN